MSQQQTLPLTHQIAFGCIASGTSEMATLPFDTLKVYVQSKATHPNPPTTFQAFQFLRQSNPHPLTPFYSAWAPSLARQSTYTGIRLGLYGYLHDRIPNQNLPTKIVTGGICGMLGNIVALPFDVIKTRIQSTPHHSSLTTANRIFHKEGPQGFFRGLAQTCQRSATISAIQLPTYFTIQDRLTNQYPYLKDRLTLRTSIASTLTTLIVSSVVYPIDLCKSLVMSSNSTKSTLQLTRNIFKTHGITGLYRGATAGLARSIPHFYITSLIFEHLKKKYHQILSKDFPQK